MHGDEHFRVWRPALFDIEMPSQFILAVSGDGVNMRGEGRVIWRLGGELGVEFVGRAC